MNRHETYSHNDHNVYMPTSAHPDKEIECIYEELDELIKLVKGDENLMVVGDWYAKLGEGKEDNVVGPYMA